jgi:hypothetical protein
MPDAEDLLGKSRTGQRDDSRDPPAVKASQFHGPPDPMPLAGYLACRGSWEAQEQSDRSRGSE